MVTGSSSTGSERCLPTAQEIERVIDGILGKPFRRLGRGPAEFYCLGIWLYLVEVLRGIRIEDPFQEPSEAGLRGFWRRFLPLPDLQDLRPLDLLFWRWGKGQPHVVTVEGPRWCISIAPGSGVHRLPLVDAAERCETAHRLRELW